MMSSDPQSGKRRHLLPLILAVIVALPLAAGCSRGAGSGGETATAKRDGGPTVAAPAPAPSSTVTAPAAPPTTMGLEVRADVVGPALPQPISRAVAVADQSTVLLLGGRTAAKVSTADVVRWSADGKSEVTGRLARRVHDSAAVVLKGSPVLFGGGDGGSVDEVQSVVLGGNGTVLGQLPERRSDLSAAILDSTAYVIGGFDDSRGVTSVLATTDGKTFSAIAELPRELRYGAVVSFQGRILVFGGEGAEGTTTAILAIDPGAGTVEQVGTLPNPLSHASAFVLGDEVYVAGGETGSVKRNEIWRFDIADGSVSAAGVLPDARSDAATAVVGTTAYIVGGESPSPLTSVIAVTRAP